MNKIKKAITKIQATGVDLVVRDGRLKVRDSSGLTDAQKRWLREHHKAIITELQTTTVHDLDRHVAEKQAATRYCRFLHNGVEVDFAGGATVAEAYNILGCESDDMLEPVIEHESNDVPLPASLMPGWQETTIRLWLKHIDEDDSEIVAETINKCHADVDDREFFLDRARKALGYGVSVTPTFSVTQSATAPESDRAR